MKEKLRNARIKKVMQTLKDIGENSGDLQTNHTPMEICDMMLEKVDLNKAKSILVLYNLELLFALRKANYTGNVTYFTQSESKVKYAMKLLPNVNIRYIGIEENPLEFMKKWPEKFDIIVANPPYSKDMDLKFLNKAKDILNESGECVFVHPASVYIDKKRTKKINSDTINSIGKNIKKLVIFNGNPVFNIGIFPPCAIVHIQKSQQDIIQFNNFISTEDCILSSIDDIHILGCNIELFNLIDKIKNKITKTFQDNVKVDFKAKTKEIYSKRLFWIGMSKGRGNVYMKGESNLYNPMWKEDFFTFVSSANTIKEIGEKINLPLWFEFNTRLEAKNFLNFIKSDFARFCLGILKKDVALNSNMYYVPWLDFTQEWRDEKLYNHFNITEEEQAFIKEIIPKYYD